MYNSFFYSGIGLNNNTDIYAEFLFPCVKFDSNFNAEIELLSTIRIPTSGLVNLTLSK